MEVELGQNRAELVGIDQVAHSARIVDAQDVAELLERPVPRHGGDEQPFRTPALHRNDPIAGDDFNGGRCRLQRTNDGATVSGRRRMTAATDPDMTGA